MISCLIVNFNCLQHTKNLIYDLQKQSFQQFELTIMDQNSIETGTEDFLIWCEVIGLHVIRNTSNRPLNHLWNEFVKTSLAPYSALLNNDIRIPSNFLIDTVTIFQEEPDVSCVIHPTNHKDHSVATTNETSYAVLTDRTRQGWDFSVRNIDWIPIPSSLEFYCGDDFIFENIYQNGKTVAIALSSPIIHLLSQTRKSPLNKVIPNRNPTKDVMTYKSLGYDHYLNILDKYSKLEPEIPHISEELHEHRNN